MRARLLFLTASVMTIAALSACSSNPGTTSTTSTSTGQGGSTTTSTTAGQGGGSGGTGGNATTGGGNGGMGTGGAGTGGATTTGAGGAGGGACVWSNNGNSCGPGMYCNAPGCAAGQCEPLGSAEMGTKKPVCGCDDLTYWNASLPAKKGMSVATAQACSPGKTCGGFGGLQCPAGASCNYHLQDIAECQGADLGGACWVMPAVCDPGPGFGPQTRACGANLCTDECALIKQQTMWYSDNTCPQ